MKKRIIELDILRASAIILMLIFHIAVDLREFFGVALSYRQGLWGIIGPLSAYIFMTVSGISSTLSRNNLKRGLIVFGCGLIITAATYIFIPNAAVVFGILQFLSICMIIYHFMQRLPAVVFIISAAIGLIMPHLLSDITTSSYLLLPFGVMPSGFQSLDYYPLFPYISLFFMGNFIGKTVYRKKTTLFPSVVYKFPVLSFLSKHSLIIYIIHQPVFLLILSVIFFSIS